MITILTAFERKLLYKKFQSVIVVRGANIIINVFIMIRRYFDTVSSLFVVVYFRRVLKHFL